MLLNESEGIVNKFETQIEIEISNDHPTTGSARRKQLEEKHLMFRQQLEKRRAKNWKELK